MQWFYDLKTIHKMWVLITVMIAGMLTIGYTGYHYNSVSNESLGIMYNNNLIPLKQIDLVRVYTNANNANVLNLILEKDKQKQQLIVDDINTRAGVVVENLNKVESAMKALNNEKALGYLSELNDHLATFKALRNKIIKESLEGNTNLAYIEYQKNYGTFKQIISDIQNITDNISTRADNRYHKNLESGEFATKVIIGISLVSIIICVWLALITAYRIQSILGILGERIKTVASGDLNVQKIGRPEKSCIGDLCVGFDGMLIILNKLENLIKEVSKSVITISSGSEEMTAAAEQTAQGAQQVATSVQQLAAGSQQISHNVSIGADNIGKMNKAIQQLSGEAEDVATLGNDTENNANQGRDEVKLAVGKIGSIKMVAGEISGTIGELGALSSEIESIVDLIKNIAGQTNLLALNAAIEAARAGEHGKGFAVVADEVKKLATESEVATNKITSMIKEIQGKTNIAVTTMDKASNEVEEGVVVINNAGHALENIIDQVKLANSKIQGITKEINGVANNSEEIVRIVENIASVTQETAASSEEIASIVEEQTASLQEISASSQSLAKVAETLNVQLGDFKI